MNENEIVDLLNLATANFPSYQERNMMPTAELWHEALKDINFVTAKKALIIVLSRSRFFPTVADIREAANSLNNPRQLDWSEAWMMITDAIKRFGMYRQKEGMESLPPDVRDAAKQFGWHELCVDDNPGTLRAQFRMAWETQSKRKKEMATLPQEIREMIEGMSENMKLLGD